MVDVILLDVGHGSAAVISDKDGYVVIDGGMGQVLLQYLHGESINNVDTLIVSHQDADHLGGAVELLLDETITLKSLHLNPDVGKNTRLSQNLLVAAAYRESLDTNIIPHLSVQSSMAFIRDSYSIEVLYPTGTTALAGVGGVLDGSRLTSNRMSGVLMLRIDGKGAVLFASDMGQRTLSDMLARNIDLRANYLVFPHHGGLVETIDERDFARKLTAACSPDGVIFSIGRGMHGTPRPEVVSGVRDVAPDCWIACTQLSEHCSTKVPSVTPAHLWTPFARGFASNSCCAGTIRLSFSNGGVSNTPSRPGHLDFIQQMNSPLCLGKIGVSVP